MVDADLIPRPGRIPLPRPLRKRWAKAKRNFEVGLWGVDVSRCVGVTFTTRRDAVSRTGISRNTWRCIREDNRMLRLVLRKWGLEFEDCLVGEVSPGGLLHLHGFYRFSESSCELVLNGWLHEMISTAWGVIHDSPVVWVEEIYWAKGMMNYDVKHALKNYMGENGEVYEGLGLTSRRILKSRGWLPKGVRAAEREIVRWAMSVRDWCDDEEDELEDKRILPPYVPFKWQIANDLLWRWCNGETVDFDIGDILVVINGDKINRGLVGF